MGPKVLSHKLKYTQSSQTFVVEMCWFDKEQVDTVVIILQMNGYGLGWFGQLSIFIYLYNTIY